MERELTPHLLSEWYPEGLFLIDEMTVRQDVKTDAQQKKYLVISREPVAQNQALMDFLMGIIQACKISMNEVNIVTPKAEADYRQLQDQYAPSFVLMFGIETSEVDLPLVFPHFQFQSFNNVRWVSSPDLTIIQHDKTMKTKLWTCLKQAFAL